MTYYNNFRKCDHFHEAILMDKWTVYASSSTDAPSSLWKPDEIPDLFVALASTWLSNLEPIKAWGIPNFKTTALCPYILIRWDDLSPCPEAALKQALPVILQYIKAGKRVEVGCQGGHGRTGSLLTMLLGIIENLPPREAIEKLRARYCDEAVESIKQIEQIYVTLGSTTTEANKDWYVPPKTYTVTDPVVSGKKDTKPWDDYFLEKYGITYDEWQRNGYSVKGGL